MLKRIRSQYIQITFKNYNPSDWEFLFNRIEAKLKRTNAISSYFIYSSNNALLFTLETELSLDIKSNRFFCFGEVESDVKEAKPFNVFDVYKLRCKLSPDTFFECSSNLCREIRQYTYLADYPDTSNEYPVAPINTSSFEKDFFAFENTNCLLSACLSSLKLDFDSINSILDSALSLEQKQFQIINRKTLFCTKKPQKVVLKLNFLLSRSNPSDYGLKTFGEFLCLFDKFQKKKVDIESETLRTARSYSYEEYLALCHTFIFLKAAEFLDFDVGFATINELSKEVYSSFISKEIISFNKEFTFVDPSDCLTENPQDPFAALKERVFLKKTKFKMNLCDGLFQAVLSRLGALFVSDSDCSSASVYLHELKPGFTKKMDDLLSTLVRQVKVLHPMHKDEFSLFISSVKSGDFFKRFNTVENKSAVSELIFTSLEGLGLITVENKTEKKKKIQTTKYFSVSNPVLLSLIGSIATESLFPCLTEPKKITNLNVFSKGDASFENGTKELEAINYLSSIPYKINKAFFSFIQVNWYLALLLFLVKNEFKALDAEALFEHAKDKLILRDLDSFVENHPDMLSFNRESVDLKLKVALIDERKKLRLTLSNKHLCLQLEVLKFFEIFFCASSLLKENSFYFKWYCDFRLRKYSISSPINPQGCTLSRMFLSFDDKQERYPFEKLDIQLVNSIHNEFTNYYEWFLSSLKREENSKLFPALMYNRKLFHVSMPVNMDITASGFHILSLLLGYEKGLIETNFFVNAPFIKGRRLLSEKADFYKTFIVGFKQDLLPEFSDEFLKKYFLIDFLGITSLLTLLAKASLPLFTRTFFKGILMRRAYSEKMISRVITIKEILNLGYDSETEEVVLSFFNENVANVLGPNSLTLTFFKKKIATALAFYFASHFDNTYQKLCPEFDFFQNLLEVRVAKSKKILERKAVCLKISNTKVYTTVFYRLWSQESLKYPCFNIKTRKPGSFVLKVDTEEMDKRRLSQSLTPNFIHRLDAAILANVVLLCKNAKIPISTAHDCIRTDIIFLNKIQKFYFDTCFEMFFGQEDILEVFLKANSTDIEFSSYSEFLSKCKTNRLLIFDKYYVDQSIIMSPFIFTP